MSSKYIKILPTYRAIKRSSFGDGTNTLKRLGYNKTRSFWHEKQAGKQNTDIVADLDDRNNIDPLGVKKDSRPGKENTPAGFKLDTAEEILANQNTKSQGLLGGENNLSIIDDLIGAKPSGKDDLLLPWQRADEGGSDMQKAFSGIYDSTLANGGDGANSSASSGSNGEQREEGGSVVNFLVNAGAAIIGMGVGMKAGEAVDAAEIGSSTVKLAAENGVSGLFTAGLVAASEDTEQSLVESAVSTAVGVVSGIWGAAVSIGLSGANEMHKETTQTQQNICLSLVGTPYGGNSRSDCLNWGPNGKPWSAEKMEAVRDYLYNGNDPAKIAKEQWENKDPLTNPGEGGNNGGENGSGSGSGQAGDWFTNQQGVICPIDENIVDPFEMQRMAIADPSLGFLINPGEGGNNGGEGGGLDEGGDPFGRNPFGQPSDNSDGTTTLI